MNIYVDADACPVIGLIECVAKKYNVPVTLLCDTNHILSSDYSEVKTIGAGTDGIRFQDSFEKLVMTSLYKLEYKQEI